MYEGVFHWISELSVVAHVRLVKDVFLLIFAHVCVLHQNLPESNPLVMEERRRQNAMMMQVLKEAAETNENVARGFWSPRK